VLFGRQRERGVLDRLLVGARDGHGGAILVLGEPGIGKTALIEQAVTSAQDFRVLRTGLGYTIGASTGAGPARMPRGSRPGTRRAQAVRRR